MSENEHKGLDIFGIKPIAEAANTTVRSLLEGIGAFLGRICLPAAEEFGLLLRDRISYWRVKNFAKIAEKAQAKLLKQKDAANRHAHPRIVNLVLEHGSWSDEDLVQEMWAGLLASSCTPDGRDDSNLIFISLLSQLTSLQTSILNYCCETAEKGLTKSGLIAAGTLELPADDLLRIAGIDNIHRLDRELDHLRSLQLIDADLGGLHGEEDSADITPSPLGLHLYVRSQGSLESPEQYFGLLDDEAPNFERIGDDDVFLE